MTDIQAQIDELRANQGILADSILALHNDLDRQMNINDAIAESLTNIYTILNAPIKVLWGEDNVARPVEPIDTTGWTR